MQLYDVNDDIDVGESTLNDSLTSLQWLTVVNSDDILDGKPSVPYTPPSPAPSSEGGDDKCLTRLTRDIRLCVDNCRGDCPVKPPYSYAELIIMAIKSSVSGKMTLRDIYKWITDNFPFYRKAESSWKNSIRHNLSLSQCFVKIPRKKGDPGKGGYWSIVPEYANMKLLKRTIRKRHSPNVFNYDGNSLSKQQERDQIETEHNSADTKLEEAFEETEDTLSPKTYLDARKFDDENISALANRLEEEMSENDTDAAMIPSFVNTFAGAIRTDCIWSSELNDSYSQGMSKMTNELLEARGIRINDSGVRNTKDKHNTEDALLKTFTNGIVNSDTLPPVFCLSPPLSDEDEEFPEKFPHDLYEMDY